ncbi:hypothetical protein AX16_003624 [Volvariella volvacea WC 439]|nr:hypothetical protein AX16_003624 [Volvariella volvacea WC 439]
MPAHIRRNGSEDTLYDESCPLVNDDPELQKPAVVTTTPLPKAQLAALCAIRLADPVAFTQIFPYINEFITSLRLTDDPSKIGYYSGLVESSFAIAQLFSIYHWAKLSDIIGRRPVIIAGTLGLSITTTLLGICSSLPEILLSRCLAGLFSGNIAVIHSVLGELTDETNQAIAFPIYGLFWPLGSIIGPLIGGTLSNAATKYPQYFDYHVFKVHPYFLPCLIAAILALFGVALGYYCLEETLPSKRRQTKKEKRLQQPATYGSISNRGSYDDDTPLEPPPAPLDMKELLSIPSIRALCASGCALCFIATAFDVVFVLFCYTPIPSGGLGFDAQKIGYSLATAGTISACIQLFLMPTLLRTFDVVKFYNFCMALWPISFVSLPLLNIIIRTGYDEVTGTVNPHAIPIVWSGIAALLVCSRVSLLAYSLNMILAKKNAPHPGALGATNGLIQLAMCISRAVSPAFVSSAFAMSIKNNIAGGYMWVFIMVLICFLGRSLSKRIGHNHKG